MKPVIILLCLVLVLFFNAGYFIVFHMNQQKLKAGASLTFSKKKQIHLLFTTNEFQRYRVNKGELVIRGEWYDIESVSEQNGRVRVVCHHDEQETRLVQKLGFLFDGKSHSSVPPVNSLAHFFSPALPEAVLSAPVSPVPSAQLQWEGTVRVASVARAVNSPPPEGTCFLS